MKLIDCSYQEGMFDGYTLVFAERDPRTSSYAMLVTDHEGRMLSRWIAHPHGENQHFGICIPFAALSKELAQVILSRREEE